MIKRRNAARTIRGWLGRSLVDRICLLAAAVFALCESHNIIDVVQAQQEWASDCVHWTASEILAVGNDATATTRKAVEWLGEAVRERGDQPLQKTKARTKTEADHPIQRAAAE